MPAAKTLPFGSAGKIAGIGVRSLQAFAASITNAAPSRLVYAMRFVEEQN